MTKTLSPHTVNLLALLDDIPERAGAYAGQTWVTRFTAEPGQARDRVIVQKTLLTSSNPDPDWSREQRFVRCFVDRASGDIIYSASWSTPAKWKTGWAIEFHGDEHDLYAKFTADGGWGYKGDREKWENERRGDLCMDLRSQGYPDDADAAGGMTLADALEYYKSVTGNEFAL